MKPNLKKPASGQSDSRKQAEKADRQVIAPQAAHRSSGKMASQGSLAGSQSQGNVTFSNNRQSSKRKKSTSKTMKDLQTPKRPEDRARSAGKVGKVRIPSTVQTVKDRRLESAKNLSPEKTAKKASRSRSKERKSRSQSKKKKRDRSEKSKQTDLRRQIAIKEAQLAKMTATADKLRKKIYDAAQPGSVRGAENFNPNKETIINNIQVGDPKQDSFQQQPSSGSQVSKGERDILRSRVNSIRSQNQLGVTKSTQVGGGIRTQERSSLPRNDNQGHPSSFGYESGVRPYQKTSPLRQPNYGTVNSGQRTDYMTIQDPGSQGYGTHHTRQHYDSLSRQYATTDQFRQQTIDARKSSPLRPAQSKSRSPPKHDSIPVRGSRVQDRYARTNLNTDLKESPAVELLNNRLRDKVQNITTDIQSLRRRLDTVQGERTRVMQERDGLRSRLTDAQFQVRRLENTLNNDKMAQKQTQMVKDEIEWQRDANTKSKKEIDNMEQHIKEIQIQITTIRNDHQNARIKNQDDTSQVAHLEHQAEVLTQKKLNALKDIQILSQQYTELKQDEHLLGAEVLDLETKIARLQNERNQLIEELEMKQHKANTESRGIDVRKSQLLNESKIQTKFMTAKIFANMMYSFHQARVADAFNEIKAYGYFDYECSERLKTLKVILRRLTEYKQRAAIQQWYNYSLKPYEVISQNIGMLSKMHEKNIKLQCFNVFRNRSLARRKQYLVKTDGVLLVWNRLSLNYKKELKRAVNIWKEVNQQRSYRIKRIRRTLLKRYKHELQLALNVWRMVGEEVEMECRTVLLKRQYIERTYMASVFNALKEAVLQTKKLRLIRQGVVFNAWRHYIAWKRHNLAQNVSILTFQAANKRYITKVCFDALKHNKQKRATKLITIALRENMDVALQEYQNHTHGISKQIERKSYKRSCQIFSDCLQSHIMSYFIKWKEFTKYKRNKLITSFQDGQYRFYRALLLNSFLKWKRRATKRRVRLIEEKIGQLETHGAVCERDIIDHKQERQKHGFVRSGQSGYKFSKAMRKYVLRWENVGLYRWRERVRQLGYMKERHASIHMKMRKRLLGDAFGRYLEFYLYCKQHDRNVVSAGHLTYAFDVRAMRRCFDAHCAFVHKQRRAKNYVGRILIRMDLWMKRRAMVTWRKNGNIKFLYELDWKQMHTVKTINDLTKTKGDLDKENNEYLKQLDDAHLQMKRTAHKQLGNFMVRHCGSILGRSFTKWKKMATSLTRRRLVLMDVIDHWRKYQYYYVKNSFKTWISNTKCDDMDERRRQVLIEQNEQQQAIDYSLCQLDHKRKDAKTQMVRLQNRQQFKKGRTDYLIGVMTRRNFEQDFYSKKRLIFCTWRHCVKQQKAFLICTKTVLEKSMYMKGFLEIQETARKKKRDQKVYNLCHKFFQTFSHNQYHDFFFRWKQSNLERVMERYNIAHQSKMETDGFMCQKITDVKDHQTACVEHYIVKRWKKKMWTAWVNRNFKQDQLAIKNQNITEVLKAVHTKRALQKWFHRVQCTKRIRQNYRVMQENKLFRLKLMAWDGLSFRRGAAMDMTQSLANLERFMRSKIERDAHKVLSSYATSKKHASWILKNRAARDIASRLTYIHDTKLKGYFLKYKLIVLGKRMRALNCKRILLKIETANLRDGFNRWARYMQNEVFCQEMNETGPQTEYVFEAKRLMHNLIEFMRDEHFTEEEILRIKNQSSEYNEHLMHKVILRLKAGKAKRAAIMLLEHWKMMIAVKKMFRYYIYFGNAQVTWGKCDMRWAFSKWKQSDEVVAGSLRKKRYRILTNLNNQQTKVLEKQASQEAESSTVINHMNIQRDELLDHFIRSQKLALSALAQNHLRSRRKALNRWKQEVYEQRRAEHNQMIREGVEQIAEVKERSKRVELENESLAKENDELRRFSMDGFVIARNVQQLSEDREKLSVDLADKTEQIKELLIQNRKLREALTQLGYDPDEHVHTKTMVRGPRIKSQSPQRVDR